MVSKYENAGGQGDRQVSLFLLLPWRLGSHLFILQISRATLGEMSPRPRLGSNRAKTANAVFCVWFAPRSENIE